MKGVKTGVAIALVGVLAGGGGAYAAGQITSAQIKDGTITSKDIKKGTITATNRTDRSGAVLTIRLPIPANTNSLDTAA